MNLEIELNEELQLNQQQVEFYKKNNFIKVKNVFSPELIAYFNRVITKKVNEVNQQETPLEGRDTYGKAFLQLFNLWELDEEIKKFVSSRRMAHIAAQLMEVEGVRLYHDQALFKEAGGNPHYYFHSHLSHSVIL